MNLKPVGSTYAAYSLQCCKCKAFKPGPRMFFDLDGEPFKDYYCTACKNKLTALKKP